LHCEFRAVIVTWALIAAVPCVAQQLTNDKLSLTVAIAKESVLAAAVEAVREDVE
jgi:hypothetical protein